MGKTISLELPEKTLDRYQQGANAAQKELEAFLLDRLEEAGPPVADELPPPVREELKALETLDDGVLQEVANSVVPQEHQRLYEDLLDKNSEGTITADERKTLRALGDDIRRLTLKKAHAHMVLKWRGHAIPLSRRVAAGYA